MILSSEIFRKLERKYANAKLLDIPSLLYQLKFGAIKDEIKFIDEILKSVDNTVAQKWINEFVSSNNGKHLGGWFEIRLYDWLRKIKDVDIEPEFSGDFPDFKIENNGQKIFIEAKAFPKSPNERRKERMEFYLNKTLSKVKYPVIINIEDYKPGKREVDPDIIDQLQSALPVLEGDSFSFEDRFGNKVDLKIKPNSHSDTALVIGPSSAFWVNTDLLKKPLKEKSSQHSSVRKSNHPYVIAIFLESSTFGCQDIVQAWFGKQKLIIDSKTLEVKSNENDLSGLHLRFGKSRIFHTSVSGTLVFKISGLSNSGFRTLKSWFIQNPYAKIPVDTDFFPVEDKFIIQTVKDRSYQMGWLKHSGER